MRNLCEEDIHIPRQATRDLAGFRAWAVSPRFPEHGRVDFLAGHLEVDMSPEDLHTHGTVKSRIAALLDRLVVDAGLGEVYIDRARISSPWADLSVEPDVVVVFWETLDSGRLRYIPAASGEPDRYIEMEGAPDVVVEVVSNSSERQDLVRLPPLYAAAGIPELWLVDVRQKAILFEIRALGPDGYEAVKPDAAGWRSSPRLGRRFRLVRKEVRPGRWIYRLEHDGEG
ncbi:MAG TPA: Uma2 family endonuclease [Thermoanaerobaculia bacterium]|jgi:Uma2 family endonuclease